MKINKLSIVSAKLLMLHKKMAPGRFIQKFDKVASYIELEQGRFISRSFNINIVSYKME